MTVKNVPARTMQAMKFPGAKHGLSGADALHRYRTSLSFLDRCLK